MADLGHVAFRRALLCVAIGFVTHAWPPVRSSAQPGPSTTYALTWTRAEGAESCASRELIVASMGDLVAPMTDPASGPRFTVRGQIRHDSATSEWHAVVQVEDAQGLPLGEREIRSAEHDCASLTPSLLLVLRLTMAQALSVAAAPPPAPGAPDMPAALSARPLAVPASSNPPAPRAVPVAAVAVHHAWEAFAALGLALGIQPSATAGVSVGARWVTRSAFTLGLSGTYWLAHTVALAAEPRDGQVEFHALQGELTTCVPVVRGAVWAWRACAGGVLGSRSVGTAALREPHNAVRVYTGPAAGTELHYALTRSWWLTLGVYGAALGPRPRFTYQDLDGRDRLIFRPPPISGWSSLAVCARY